MIAHEIAWQHTKHYDPLLSKESWCEMAAREAIDWADETMMDKACEWLYNALYTRANGAEHYVASKEKITQTEFVAKFRKAMEE